ncbi:pyridoxamine 5'-phosphate oxidase family protein [Moorella naiadis]|uniref:pyridoxamine 5'-phosphate oxidase family protein n=1 Tax=Moorella naiadis (nom. illeg.) TaxID=3093670 RepID=UPI003D9C7EFC
MAKLNTEIKNVIAKQGVFPVATASKDGIPNVVPMTFVKVYDDHHLLVVDNFMKKSKDNLINNPYITVCTWNLEDKQSYQIKGKATIHTSGRVFDDAVAWVKQANPALHPQSAVLVEITNVYICQPGDTLGKEL